MLNNREYSPYGLQIGGPRVLFENFAGERENPIRWSDYDQLSRFGLRNRVDSHLQFNFGTFISIILFFAVNLLFLLQQFDLEFIKIFVYKIIGGGAITERLQNGSGGDGSGKDGDETSASNHWLLPTQEYYGLWESLYFEEGLKEKVNTRTYFCLLSRIRFFLIFYISYSYLILINCYYIKF